MRTGSPRSSEVAFLLVFEFPLIGGVTDCTLKNKLTDSDSGIQSYHLKPLNWEGLGWFEPGKSLVMTYDNIAEQSPEAYVIHLPKGG